MTLQDIVQRYRAGFTAQFGHTLSRDQWSALNAIEGCRQGQYGEMHWRLPGLLAQRPYATLLRVPRL